MNIIAIAGNARSGKNKLASFMKQILEEEGEEVELVSFAHELKSEVNELLQNALGISAFTEDDKSKSIIRPFLTFWGTTFRRALDPSVWINKIESKLIENKTYIITDMRYENELDWVHKQGGTTIFLERVSLHGSIVPAANSIEMFNNAAFKFKSHHQLTWYTEADDILLKKVRELVNNIYSIHQV